MQWAGNDRHAEASAPARQLCFSLKLLLLLELQEGLSATWQLVFG